MNRDLVMVAGPSPSAIGGVATHTTLLLKFLPEARRFDQWWPLRERSTRGRVRVAVHALALLRWVAVLILFRPGVVHLQVTAPGMRRDVAHLRIARMLGHDVVSHIHTSGFYRGAASLAVDAGLEQVLRLSTNVIVMSRSLEGEISRRHPDLADKVVFIANPVPELVEPLNLDDDAPRVAKVRLLCVGPISDHKGQAALIEAAEALADEGHAIDVELVGPWGDLGNEEKRRIDASPIVRISGTLQGPELTAAYDRADIFVLFSMDEAEPLAMLEAMSRQLPVVATRVGGIPETLNAVPGNALVAQGNSAELVAALRDLACDRSKRLSIGEANKRYVSEHRLPEAHAARINQLHRAVAAARRRDRTVE
jgi:glycosyltransferase involved in cell wall biosynthesis